MNRDLWFKFYPLDWIGDLELRAVSLEARGVYIDLLCRMYQAQPVGYWLVNGVVPQESLASQVLGIHPKKYSKCLKELLNSGVLKKGEGGRIYSRRILLDCEKRDIARGNGKLGGNPNLVNLRVNPPLNQGVNPIDNPPLKAPLKLYIDIEEKRIKKETNKESVVVNFEEFWTKYPNKQGRLKAQEHYSYWRKTKEAAEIMAALNRYLAAKTRLNSTTFANGSTWLNPKPRGDSANIADYWGSEAVTCLSCKRRNGDDGYCEVLQKRVMGDMAACKKHKGKEIAE